MAARLSKSGNASDYSEKSLVYAVNEVCAAVISEAETIRATQSAGGTLELHGCTDSAWTGTSARGSGIAMDERGKELVVAAAERVAQRLAQPALKLSRLPR